MHEACAQDAWTGISCGFPRRYLLFGILTGAVYTYLAIVLLARKLMRRQFAQRSWRIARMVRRPHALYSFRMDVLFCIRRS